MPDAQTTSSEKPSVLPGPGLVSWNITSACNLRCPHCYLDAGSPREGELSTEDCFSVVDQLADLGTELLILTGGEPLMRSDVDVIIRRAVKKGLVVVLGTNGVLIDRERAHELVELGVAGVGISVDSLDPVKHDEFRGLSGAWERTIESLRVCAEVGLRRVMQTTLMSWNFDEIPALVEFASSLEVESFNLYYVVCTGRGEKVTDISPQQYEESLVQLLELQDRYPKMMVRAKCAPHARRIAQQRGSVGSGSAGCLAATNYLRITPEGAVTPCPYMPTVVGQVPETALSTVWTEAPLLRALREPELKGKCGACDFGDICIGCRARALATTEDHLGEDPWCTYEPGPVRRTPPETMGWTPEAETRLSRIPGFIRAGVKAAIEDYVRQAGYSCVTPELMAEVRSRMGMRGDRAMRHPEQVPRAQHPPQQQQERDRGDA